MYPSVRRLSSSGPGSPLVSAARLGGFGGPLPSVVKSTSWRLRPWRPRRRRAASKDNGQRRECKASRADKARRQLVLADAPHGWDGSGAPLRRRWQPAAQRDCRSHEQGRHHTAGQREAQLSAGPFFRHRGWTPSSPPLRPCPRSGGWIRRWRSWTDSLRCSRTGALGTMAQPRTCARLRTCPRCVSL